VQLRRGRDGGGHNGGRCGEVVGHCDAFTHTRAAAAAHDAVCETVCLSMCFSNTPAHHQVNTVSCDVRMIDGYVWMREREREREREGGREREKASERERSLCICNMCVYTYVLIDVAFIT